MAGMRVMNKKPTQLRMKKILEQNGIKYNKFVSWTGLKTLKEWLELNPTWTEREWYELVCENMEAIKIG